MQTSGVPRQDERFGATRKVPPTLKIDQIDLDSPRQPSLLGWTCFGGYVDFNRVRFRLICVEKLSE